MQQGTEMTNDNRCMYLWIVWNYSSATMNDGWNSLYYLNYFTAVDQQL